MPEDVALVSASGGAFRSLLSTPGFLLLLTMNLLKRRAYWPVRNWLAEFFRAELGVAGAWAGVYGPMTFNGAAFLGMLIASNLSDWWAGRNVRARALVPAIGFLIAAPCLFVLGEVDTCHHPRLRARCGDVARLSRRQPDAGDMYGRRFRYRATAYGLLNFVGTIAGGVYVRRRPVKGAANPVQCHIQVASGLILGAGLLLFLGEAGGGSLTTAARSGYCRRKLRRPLMNDFKLLARGMLFLKKLIPTH